MIINMLRAINKMLLVPTNSEDIKSRVLCARMMLEEIIKGMEQEPKPADSPPIKPEPEPKPEKVEVNLLPAAEDEPSKPIVPPKDKPYRIMAHQGKLIKIENYPLESMVELDGKVMTHKEALGKTFKSGKLLS